MLCDIPCSIGDTVWALWRYKDKLVPKEGKVSEMYFTEDMTLCIVVRNIRRGIWGSTIFATKEEAMAELERRKEFAVFTEV